MIRIVCGTCFRYLGHKGLKSDRGTSHSICGYCVLDVKKQLAQWDKKEIENGK